MEFKQYDQTALKQEFKGELSDRVIVSETNGEIVAGPADDSNDKIISVLKDMNYNIIRMYNGLDFSKVPLFHINEENLNPTEYINELEATILA